MALSFFTRTRIEAMALKYDLGELVWRGATSVVPDQGSTLMLVFPEINVLLRAKPSYRKGFFEHFRVSNR